MLPTLHPGSRVAVVAPAGPVDPSAYAAGLEILAARYTVIQSHDPDESPPQSLPYLAGDDQTRASALNRALRDPAVEAIFCARGGYGCLRLLERLDGEALTRHRPLLVGFSDCTALHAWTAGLGVPSIHGPVVTQLRRLPPGDLEHLFALLEGSGAPSLANLRTVVPGHASGPLFGGNLSLLCHLCGTPYLPDLRGRILLIEEVAEPPYRIDRMLTHLALCGVLRQVAGIVVGRLEGCDGPQGRPPRQLSAEAVIRDRLGRLQQPVVIGANAGHGDRNLALPLGVVAQLDAEDGLLRFEIDRSDGG